MQVNLFLSNISVVLENVTKCLDGINSKAYIL